MTLQTLGLVWQIVVVLVWQVVVVLVWQVVDSIREGNPHMDCLRCDNTNLRTLQTHSHFVVLLDQGYLPPASAYALSLRVVGLVFVVVLVWRVAVVWDLPDYLRCDDTNLRALQTQSHHAVLPDSLGLHLASAYALSLRVVVFRHGLFLLWHVS